MNWRLGGVLLVSLVTGFCLGLGIKFAYENLTFRPYEWKNPPIIVNCYGEDFSEAQMIRAISYWTIRDQKIGFYEHSPPSSICESKDMVLGFIVLRKARWWELDGPTLANTKRMTSGFHLVSAVVTYRPGSQNLDLINEHELGHALGFAHVDIKGHIMHPIYGRMGDGFWVP